MEAHSRGADQMPMSHQCDKMLVSSRSVPTPQPVIPYTEKYDRGDFDRERVERVQRIPLLVNRGPLAKGPVLEAPRCQPKGPGRAFEIFERPTVKRYWNNRATKIYISYVKRGTEYRAR